MQFVKTTQMADGGFKMDKPVIVHLDRAVAIDLLQALTQALEPYSSNTIDVQKAPSPKGKQNKRSR